MSNATPEGIFSGGGLPFLDANLKVTLATKKVPLAIVGAKHATRNQFGNDVVSFSIRVTDKAAKVAKDADLAGDYKLEMGANEARTDHVDAVLQLFAKGHTTIGPVYLSQGVSKGGQKFWALSESPSDEDIEQLDADDGGNAASPASEPDAEPADDDDLPF